MPPVLDIQTHHFNYNTRFSQKMTPLGAMAPPNAFFPSEDLGKCLSKVSRTNYAAINNYGYSTRTINEICSVEKVTAKYMYGILGITASESEIVHANGATDALLFTLSAVARQGDFVAVESPGYLGVYTVLRRLRITPLEVETLPPHGLNIDHLESMLKMGIKPSCLVVTPNFHNPTGSLMPLENRKRLSRLCRKNNIVIIEDDTLGALRFGKRVPALKELMPEEVVYINSYSKVMAPGYRVGWAAGGRHANGIRVMQGVESFVMTLSSHLAVAQYLDSGNFRPYITNLRKAYAENRDVMADAITSCFPEECEVFRTGGGGQYLWVTMPEGFSCTKTFFEALKHNILLAPGAMFSGTDKYDNCLRFCFAMEITQEILDAVETVGGILNNRRQV
jgi:DNA-binding transcriptional MocR family regulator